MKGKTEAAKVLLANGWTLEEVIKVLGEDKKAEGVLALYPYPIPMPQPVYPPNYWIDWTFRPFITTSGTSHTFSVSGDSDSLASPGKAVVS